MTFIEELKAFCRVMGNPKVSSCLKNPRGASICGGVIILVASGLENMLGVESWQCKMPMTALIPDAPRFFQTT
jgi:hypothetical protein